jgi:DNA-binding NarL/FixJ family response regulator
MDVRTAVLVDQHPLWLETLREVVGRAGFDVRATTTRSSEAVELLDATFADLLVTGLKMPEGEPDGLTVIRDALQRHPRVRVIVLSGSPEAEHVDAALAAGASAYVLKTAHPDDLVAAIRQSFAHSIFFAPSAEPGPRVLCTAISQDNQGLTRRELQILQLVAEGHSNADLARMLWVTEQTVKFHLSNIYRKLRVSNRTEASRWAQLHGLLSDPRAGAIA